MNKLPNPAPAPSWCDRARQNHDICEEREQHQSRWYRACSTTELDRYRLRLAQITPTEGAPIEFCELEIMRDGEILEFLLNLATARIMASALRRLVELDRRERAK
jgi:hypothetical protein